jgi:outer membrane lipoprotein-sorting protein
MKEILISLFSIFFPWELSQTTISKISSEMEVRSVFGGKSIVTKGVVYCDLLNQKTVTNLVHPVALISIQEKSGEVFSYDSKSNVVIQKKSQVTVSSDNVFKYLLLNQGDMGLKEMGFRLRSSKINNGLDVLTWDPPFMLASKVSSVELVTQNNNPIYMANFDTKNKIINKTYYTKYQNVFGTYLPMQITDFQYIYSEKNKKDSVLTKTTFSNIKINNEMNQDMLSFKIPSNAKVISE